MWSRVEPAPTCAERDDFAASVLAGLSRPAKSLPCRFFYDARGSALFEEITRQPEYYPTKTEIAILKTRAGEMVADGFEEEVLVEFGSGSSRKTEILIENLPRLLAYVPIDVSQSALADAKIRLAKRFPRLKIQPLVGDFMRHIALPADVAAQRKLGFFPGSTIGNLTSLEAAQLLKGMRCALSPGGRMIIGVDLIKDTQRLLRAYNDSKGVTAAFNMNLLYRINQELGGEFNLSCFRHEAIYNAIECRIEMRLISLKDQNVAILGRRFHFRESEAIHTENSHKYSLEGFRQLARSAGWTPRGVWTDSSDLFSVHELVCH
jgi:dimethylhistidine N-methyltransferase